MNEAVPSTVTPDAQRMQSELEFLGQLCVVVSSTTEFKPILDWIVQKTVGLLEAEEGSIKMLGNEPAPTLHTMIRQRPLDTDPLDFAIGTSVTGWILTKGEPLLSADLLTDPRFPGLRSSKGRVRSILAVPLKLGNRIIGIIAATHRTEGRQWTPGNVQLLNIIATHSASVLENARLKEVEEEKHRMEKEMSVAKATQMRLVPSQPMTFGPWEINGLVIPARGVGGDYFDYYPYPSSTERFVVAIADVSGKGMPAALLMSNVQAALRAHATGGRPANEVVKLVNIQVARSAQPGKFVTLFYGEVDVRQGTLTYANAGHNYPLLRRGGGQVDELAAGGLMLGAFEEADFEQATVPFAPGDALLLYSDGISEASDTRDKQFGEDRLLELWRGMAGVPTAQVLDRLVKEVESFRGAAAQSDDITALVIATR
jgi:sigma-B regulation protein RsbU (phosphoserine phosphatase)